MLSRPDLKWSQDPRARWALKEKPARPDLRVRLALPGVLAQQAPRVQQDSKVTQGSGPLPGLMELMEPTVLRAQMPGGLSS